MSVAIRRAIYGKLAGDTTLTAMLGAAAPGYTKGIYYQQAPAGAGFPYVVFNKQSGVPLYALKSRAFDNDVWLIKGVDRSDTADLVDTIASRLDSLLTDSSLSISGNTLLYLRRAYDAPIYSEVVDGATYRHNGSLFRLIYE